MELQKISNRIHPLIAAAAVSVTLVSMVGIAAITGVIPTSHGTPAPVALVSPGALQDSQTATGISVGSAPQLAAAPAAEYREAAPRIPQVEAPRQYTAQNQGPAQQICKSCGKVESVRVVRHHAQPSGIGVVAGAVLGGVLGNQVGGGNGRSLATVAGAVGGGYAGNEIEKRSNTIASYQVRVRMEDGRLRHFTYAEQPNWSAGDQVRVTNGRLTSQR